MTRTVYPVHSADFAPCNAAMAVESLAMPSRSKKSFRDKRDDPKKEPQVEPIPPKLRATWGRGTFVIGTPREVDALMKQVRKGKLTTTDELRKLLAVAHGATVACPLTTGIFINIAAHAAVEDEADGRRGTPWWRTLKTGGELNAKCPGGIEEHARRLAAEGHTIEQRGKRAFVVDYEDRLQ